MALGIKTVTIEIGNPSVFQEKYINFTLSGIYRVMKFLTMIPTTGIFNDGPEEPPTICSSSYWIYTDCGGVLEVFPEVNTWVRKGQIVAEVKNMFGKVVTQYLAPEDGIIIGKATNPINQSGDRILHLGVVSNVFKNKRIENFKTLKDQGDNDAKPGTEFITTPNMMDSIKRIEADLSNLTAKTHSRTSSKEYLEVFKTSAATTPGTSPQVKPVDFKSDFK
jgi:hypothetical protein